MADTWLGILHRILSAKELRRQLLIRYVNYNLHWTYWIVNSIC